MLRFCTFYGEFGTHVTLSPHPGVVRFALSAALTGLGALKLSPADQAVWTWRSAHEAGATLPQVSGDAGHYTAVFTAPAGTLVTLRTHAADAAGGSVTETITSAYQVAS